MYYTFILDGNARIDILKDRLRGIEGITWRFESANLRIDVPDSLRLTIEERILDAVAASVGDGSEQLIDDNGPDNANVLCGALQSELLDKYLPIVFSSLPTGVVLEVDSIDDELVMLRMRGPKESVDVVDRISSWIMSKCAVGVHDEDQPKTAGK